MHDVLVDELRRHRVEALLNCSLLVERRLGSQAAQFVLFEPPLDPRESSFDRLEVWAVRYIPDPLDLQLAHQVLDLSCFVHGEVVHENHELPTLILGREDLQVLFEALLVEGLVVQLNVLDTTSFRYSCTDRCVTGTRCLDWDAKVCVGPGPFKFLAGRFREHTLV